MQVINKDGNAVLIDNFCQNSNTEGIDFTLQISLEANLCAGRNKSCINYFKNIYPAENLVMTITK